MTQTGQEAGSSQTFCPAAHNRHAPAGFGGLEKLKP
jgi:hypothetical protein